MCVDPERKWTLKWRKREKRERMCVVQFPSLAEERESSSFIKLVGRVGPVRKYNTFLTVLSGPVGPLENVLNHGAAEESMWGAACITVFRIDCIKRKKNHCLLLVIWSPLLAAALPTNTHTHAHTQSASCSRLSNFLPGSPCMYVKC